MKELLIREKFLAEWCRLYIGEKGWHWQYVKSIFFKEACAIWWKKIFKFFLFLISQISCSILALILLTTWSSILTIFKVIDVIEASTIDLGPLSFDSLRKNNISAWWRFVAVETSVENNATTSEVRITWLFGLI